MCIVHSPFFGVWAIGYELVVVADFYLIFVERGHASRVTQLSNL